MWVFVSGVLLVWFVLLVLGVMWVFGLCKLGWYFLIGLIGICIVFIVVFIIIFVLYLLMMVVNVVI